MDYTLEKLTQIMAKLRSPEGCPWDQEQTHLSLRRNVIEEAYEVLEAIEAQSPPLLADELGDLLLQIVFHAQIAKENGDFDIYDVIKAICEKLIRRHPHVFGDVQADTVDQVLTNWNAIKATEKLNKDRESLLDGIPRELPALMQAEKVQKKAATVGFDWPDWQGPRQKLTEEIAELEQALAKGNDAEISDELGDLLFSLVNLARHVNVDPEQSLRQTTQRFIERFKLMERLAAQENLDFAKMSFAQMDELWDRAKDYLRKNPQR